MGVVVFYDEGCEICAALAAWLARYGRDVDVAPIGSARGEHALADLSPAERYAAFHVVDGNGLRGSGGAALPTVLRAVPLGGLPAALATRFPRLSDGVYGYVAARRSVLSRVVRRASRGRAD